MGWNPAGIVALSAVLSLFFDNSPEEKTIVWVSALIVLFYNRDFVPKMNDPTYYLKRKHQTNNILSAKVEVIPT